jgi:DNA-binding MurR/RpiR family transcriptional regulator
MDLLVSCETWGHPPGPLLNNFIRELLNLERDRQGMSRDVETQELAANIVAQAPTVRTRELARALHVNASTISRWRRSPEFKQMVERKAESLESSQSGNELIGPSMQCEPTREELSKLLSAISVLLSQPRRID